MRTRPIDRIQVLVTEHDAAEIEKQYHLVSGIHDSFVFPKNEFETTRKTLSKISGREPTEYEIKAEVCKQQQKQHSNDWDWGLYRNDLFQISEYHRAVGRISEALSLLLEVCYIDLNGPNNCGGMRNFPDLLKDFPPFKPDPNGLAPVLVDYVNLISSYLNLLESDIQEQFLQIARRVQSQFDTPLPPNEAWEIFRHHLKR